MARFRRFRGRFKGRSFRGGRRFRRRGGSGGMMKFAIGAGLAFVAPQVHPLQDVIITTLAVIPMRTPFGVKKIAQGYVLGKIVKGFMGTNGTTVSGDFV